MTIDKPIYFAFIALDCYDQSHARVSPAMCIEFSSELGRHAKVYGYMGGVAISTATATKYDTSLPFTNAPRTDDVTGPYLITIKKEYSVGLKIGGATEIYGSPTDQYALCLLYTSPSPRD